MFEYLSSMFSFFCFFFSVVLCPIVRMEVFVVQRCDNDYMQKFNSVKKVATDKSRLNTMIYSYNSI